MKKTGEIWWKQEERERGKNWQRKWENRETRN